VSRAEGEDLIARIQSFSNDVSWNQVALLGNGYRVANRIR
jgi:hypothetical protein